MTKEDIINIVCEVCGINPQDLKQRSRKEPLPTARALIVHYLYREFRMFPRDISPLIGHPNYNRVSVYRYLPGGETLVEQRFPHDKYLRNHITEIDSRIQSLK